MYMETERPKFVYKYCSASRATQILRDLTFFLSPLCALNDLYEFRILSLVKTDEKSADSIYAKRMLALKLCGTHEEAIEFAASMRGTDDYQETFEFFKRQFEAMCASFMEHSGVTCFSSEPHNQRMWGTYGANHAGAMIEFTTDAAKAPFFQHLCPVIYLSEKLDVCPTELLTEDGGIDARMVGMFLGMKHLHWMEEREWRLLLLADRHQSESERLFKFPCSAISRVFLGPRMSPDDNAAVREAAESHGCEIGVFEREIDPLLARESFVGIERITSFDQLLYWHRYRLQ